MTERFAIKDISGEFHAASDRKPKFVEDEKEFPLVFWTYTEASSAIKGLPNGIYLAKGCSSFLA